MQIPHLFTIALRSLLKNKFRSFLTMLGVVIGVLSVVLLVSIGSGLQKLVTGELQGLGSNLVIVVPGKVAFEPGGGRGGALGSFASSKLKLEDVERLREIPDIANVAGVAFASSPIKYLDEEKVVQVAGTTEDFADVRSAALTRGEFFGKADVISGKKVLVLGATVAEDLFGNISPIGKKVLVGDSRYIVIGVFEKTGGFGQTSIDDQVFVPLAAVEQQFNVKNLGFINIEVSSSENVVGAIEEVKTVLSERLDEDEFTVIDQKEILSAVSGILGGLTVALGGIAAISLVVGGIGIMNIMLVTVAERTREIGLRKAIGATPKMILSQFLIESVVLSAGGGMIGLALGILGSFIIGRFVTTEVTWWSILLAFGVSVAIGIIFGSLPARRASRLTPVEALRYE